MGKHNVTVLDIGQAEIHDMLSLGMLIEAPAEPGLSVLKEIVFMAHHLGLTVGTTPQQPRARKVPQPPSNFVRAFGSGRALLNQRHVRVVCTGELHADLVTRLRALGGRAVETTLLRHAPHASIAGRVSRNCDENPLRQQSQHRQHYASVGACLTEWEKGERAPYDTVSAAI